jgi:Tol biopolymer transport system component
MPGSKGLAVPRWSPDGRYIVSLDLVDGALMLWDFETRAWKRLVGPARKHNPVWTRDSRHLYFQSFTDQEDAIYRVGVPDGRLERLVNAKRFGRADVSHSVLAGIAPDDSPLVMLVRDAYDISALDLDLP